MQRFGALLLLLTLVSCQFFGSTETAKKELVQKELESMNWNEVDRYPLFEDCDETADKAAQRQCFQMAFTSHFFSTLQQHRIEVRGNLNDTVKVELLIDKYGSIIYLDSDINENVKKEIPEFEDMVERSLQTLPQVYPALKRDIPVSTKVVLPIVLKVD
ncbi:hypothetical protein [Robertkochia aurantiaca]|uniref:hypothetical protein n=1 Tax=Robertkochia aurantiaca TaxID=2873700 RepID=UPI001CCFA15B|nr:hypothetical protein [Robertkochia sp. 3YJGBD-33]